MKFSPQIRAAINKTVQEFWIAPGLKMGCPIQPEDFFTLPEYRIKKTRQIIIKNLGKYLKETE